MDNPRIIHAPIFQSTLPSRGATLRAFETAAPLWYFNPRSPRGERLFSGCSCPLWDDFNPRSPRGERRGAAGRPMRDHRDFNPRSPRGERHRVHQMQAYRLNFNPRSPRGERLHWADGIPGIRYFNPRSPRGERLGRASVPVMRDLISIHAPLAGSDTQPK